MIVEIKKIQKKKIIESTTPDFILHNISKKKKSTGGLRRERNGETRKGREGKEMGVAREKER